MMLTGRSKTKYRVRSEALEKQNSKAQVDAACPICQEPIGTPTTDGITECWSILPCGHRFGSHCIKHYLKMVATERPACPVCRNIAYHKCGHPVLPALLKRDKRDSRAVEREHIEEASELLVEEMKFSDCSYCHKKSEKRARWPADQRTNRVVVWCRRLIPSRFRQSKRDKAHAQYDTARQLDEGLASVWRGPYVDPFPRERDLRWERWYDRQQPCEHSRDV